MLITKKINHMAPNLSRCERAMSVDSVKVCNTGSSLGLRTAAHCPVAWLGSGAFSPYQFIKLARAGEPRDCAISVPLDLKH